MKEAIVASTAGSSKKDVAPSFIQRKQTRIDTSVGLFQARPRLYLTGLSIMAGNTKLLLGGVILLRAY